MYLQVVESYREGKKVKNRTLLNLGRFDNNDALERLNKFLKVLLPVSDQFQELETKKDIHPLQTKQYGPLLIFKELWRKLELDKVLKQSFDKI